MKIFPKVGVGALDSKRDLTADAGPLGPSVNLNLGVGAQSVPWTLFS